jgi:hypothetical protein
MTNRELCEALADYNPDAEIHLDVHMNEPGGAAGMLRGIETDAGVADRDARLIWLVS